MIKSPKVKKEKKEIREAKDVSKEVSMLKRGEMLSPFQESLEDVLTRNLVVLSRSPPSDHRQKSLSNLALRLIKASKEANLLSAFDKILTVLKEMDYLDEKSREHFSKHARTRLDLIKFDEHRYSDMVDKLGTEDVDKINQHILQNLLKEILTGILDENINLNNYPIREVEHPDEILLQKSWKILEMERLEAERAAAEAESASTTKDVSEEEHGEQVLDEQGNVKESPAETSSEGAPNMDLDEKMNEKTINEKSEMNAESNNADERPTET